VWDRDGKRKSIFYNPTKEEQVQWSQRLLDIAREVEDSYLCKIQSTGNDTSVSKDDEEATIVMAGYDRNGNKSQSYKESLPPFIKAASDGKISMLQSMVQDAVLCGNEQVEKLLETKDRNGSSAEHWAAGNGHIDCLRYLMMLSEEYSYSASDPSCPHGMVKRRRKRDGKTSLHYAARNGHTHIVKYLLDSSSASPTSSKSNDVNVESGDGTTPLHLACYGGHYETIQYLIERNADLYKTNEWNCGVGHWIAMSIQTNREEIFCILNYIKTLVKDKSFDLFGRAQKQGHTSVHKAAQKLNRHFIEWLAAEVTSSEWTLEQREEAGRKDDGGHKPSEIWSQMGGSIEFSTWMKEEYGW
jgi:hypothetical protein